MTSGGGGSSDRRKTDVPGLPKGWKREEIVRKNGLFAGKCDVYYYSPSGKKFRSKPQLARYLGDTIDLSSFDFKTGKINNILLRKNKRQKGTGLYDYRNESALVPPIRQTASIFKQPVTIIRSIERTDKQKHDPSKHVTERAEIDKPKQVFWEKRLQGLQACDVNGEQLKRMKLPMNLRGVGPNIAEETVIRSIATALHVNSGPITGQTGNRGALEKNPGVFVNPDQPLMQPMMISDEDIRYQEEKVIAARRKLEEAMRYCLKI